MILQFLLDYSFRRFCLSYRSFAFNEPNCNIIRCFERSQTAPPQPYTRTKSWPQVGRGESRHGHKVIVNHTEASSNSTTKSSDVTRQRFCSVSYGSVAEHANADTSTTSQRSDRVIVNHPVVWLYPMIKSLHVSVTSTYPWRPSVAGGPHLVAATTE